MFNQRAQATYIGFTGDLEQRVLQHKRMEIPGYTCDKKTIKLGYYEVYSCVNNAIAREKAIKEWKRAWKYRLIETMNPEWKDLAEDINFKVNPEETNRVFLERLEREETKVS